VAWPISCVYCSAHNQKAHIDLLTKFISLQKVSVIGIAVNDCGLKKKKECCGAARD